MGAHGGGQLAPEIPTTVQAALAARIDQLLPEEKQLLQIAAIIGPEVPWPLLQAMEDEGNRHPPTPAPMAPVWEGVG